MKKRAVLIKCLGLFAGALILVIFAYQCHPQPPGPKGGKEKIRPGHPVRLADIREGALVRRVLDTDVYELLPQLDTRVEINIEGMVASTQVDQVFTNNSDQPLEAVYVFPLPHTAAVHDMKIMINDRFIQGVIREKGEAKKIYETAKAEGKQAGLTEQERPNIFTNSVANIMPGDTIIVRLTYVQTVEYEKGTFRLRFPIVVAPRYIPGGRITGYSGSGRVYDTDIVTDASRITPRVMPEGMRTGSRVSIHLNVNAGLPLSSIGSPSHDVQLEAVSDSAYSVSLKQKKVIPNRDFVLEYHIAPEDKPMAALFSTLSDNDRYFMLMVVPPEKANKDTSIKKDLLFVMDISGSMQGASIGQAKAGVIDALQKLNEGDYFNIIAFNDRYEAFAPTSLRASTVNVVHGINYVKGLKAQGGTEAQPALEEALRNTGQPDAVQMILFLTDGSVGNEQQLIELVNGHIGRGRLFAVGIGSAPNSYLLDKVSRSGKGTFTYIGNVDEVQERMNGLFEKIEHPVFVDLALDLPGDVETYPSPIPDLFAGEPLVIFGRSSGPLPDRTSLTGKSGVREEMLSIPLDAGAATEEPAIPTLWARSKVSRLMDDYMFGTGGSDDEFLRQERKQDIIDIAIEHKLLTQFTSFVAVEHRIINPGGKTRLSTIPTELPEGWTLEEVDREKEPVKLAYLPQTASSAPLLSLIGMVLLLTGACIVLREFHRGRNNAH